MQRPHVVSFSGELDIWKESDVEAKLAAVDGSCAAVIDLSAVRYLDSAFLSALVRLRRRLPDCSITIVAVTPVGAPHLRAHRDAPALRHRANPARAAG